MGNPSAEENMREGVITDIRDLREGVQIILLQPDADEDQTEGYSALGGGKLFFTTTGDLAPDTLPKDLAVGDRVRFLLTTATIVTTATAAEDTKPKATQVSKISETPILEQIQGLPGALSEEDIATIRSSEQLRLCASRLAEQKPEIEKVCQNSEIREKRRFSRGEIEQLIAFFAIAHKLELDKLQVSQITTDKNGTLVVMEVKSPNPDGGYNALTYTINGRHGRSQARVTNLDMILYDSDDMPAISSGYADNTISTLADYIDGKWRALAIEHNAYRSSDGKWEIPKKPTII